MKMAALNSRSFRQFMKNQFRKNNRRFFRLEWLDSLALLENRVLLADISITQPSDLAQYYNSANNTYYLNAGQDNVSFASGLTINSTGVSPFNLIISGNMVSIGSGVSILTYDTTAPLTSCQTGNIGIYANSISLGNNSIAMAAGNIILSGGPVSIGTNVQIKTVTSTNVPDVTQTGDILLSGRDISIGNFSNTTASGNFKISGRDVLIGSNVSIDTGSYSTAGTLNQAGSIDIIGRSVSLGNYSKISADGITDDYDGNINISANNEKFSLGFNYWMQIEDLYNVLTNQSASINLGNNTEITGGNIVLNANSGDPLTIETITNIIGDVGSVLMGALKVPVPQAFPVTVQSWSPYSSLTIGANTAIESSSRIQANATSTSTAKGQASWYELVESRFGFGFGLFFNDARANISILPGAMLQATGDISVSSDVTNSIYLNVSSVKNQGDSPVNPNAINISVGVGSLNTESVVYVQAGSVIDSSQGSVNITATAIDNNTVRVDGKSYRDGLATISIGTLITNANVQVIVDGKVSSGVPQKNQSEPVSVVFDQVQSLDLAKNQLNFPAGTMKFQTGQALIFDSQNGSTIPGLVPGKIYYAIVNSVQPNSLQLAATAADANNGVNIAFPTVYPTLTIGDLILPITVIDNVYSNAILFNFNTLPNGEPVLPGGNGSLVTYSPVPGQFIGINDSQGNLIGPLAAGTYTVNLYQWPTGSPQSQLYPLAIQLIDSQGQIVFLNPNSFFTASDGTRLQVSLLNAETSTVDFNFTEPTDNPFGLVPLPVPDQQVNLINGQALVYTSGLNAPIANLSNGQTYWAIVNPNQAGLIQLASSIAQAQAANSAVQDAQPRLLTVENQACVANVTSTFEKSGQSSSLILNPDNSYTLSNNASGGTFQITINGPQGNFTTSQLAYNINASGLQSALNSLPGIQCTVSGNPQLWNIAIIYNIEIGNLSNGNLLTFNSNPLLPDGTSVIYEEVSGKPVPGLVNGQTYYAFNQPNSNFISQFPQYILTLKSLNNASSPDATFDLQQSMTDSSGQNYALSYADPGSNLIALALPEVILPAIVNGNSLSGGTVISNQLTIPVLSIYSFADNGSFTLSLTNSAGVVLTTAAIPFNANSSHVQQALDALAGVSVTVVGNGTYTSPWAVSGINPSWSVSADSADLKRNGLPTLVSLNVFVENTQQIWLENATGGTFTISLSFGANQLVTAPLPYNINSQGVAEAINKFGFQANVYGSGTPTDPWFFLAYYNPFKTGAALIFNDSWGSNSLGMINGQTYYAVTSANQINPGEALLSLASSEANATAATPILLNMQGYLQFEPGTTGVMSGEAALVVLPDSATGVTISSSLTSFDYLTNKAYIGKYPPLKALANRFKGYDPYDVSALDTAKILKEIDKNSWVDGFDFLDGFVTDDDRKKLEDLKKHLKQYTYTDPKSFLEASLGLAVMVVNNNSQVIIGSQAVISSGDDIKASSTLIEQFHSEADAGVTRTRKSESDKGNLATALGLSISVINNTSQAIVQPNAELNAAGLIDIDSKISYPFAWEPVAISQLIDVWSTESTFDNVGRTLGILVNAISQALTGTNGNVGNWLFNSSSNSSTVQGTEGLIGSAIGGSFVLVSMSNNNLAQICDGVEINQGPLFQNAANQGLSVDAETQINQISGSGQLDYFLNWAGFLEKRVASANQGKNIVGGSVNLVLMDNSTQALIGGNATQSSNLTAKIAAGPTLINYGNEGLNLSADTGVNYISLSQSGGKAVKVGVEASVAVISVDSQNTTSAILSSANAPVIRNMANSTGNISIEAIDTSLLSASSGGVVAGKSFNLGFSSSVVELNRNVIAIIGNGNSASNLPATWSPVIQSAGNVTLDSKASGNIIPVSLAGSVITKTSNETGIELPIYPINHLGAGVSGSYSEAKVSDDIYAGINGGTITGLNNNQLLSISARNSTSLDVATGSASFQFEKGRDSAAGLGGAASFVNYGSNVIAGISNAAIYSFTIETVAENLKKIGTFSAGLDGASVAGIGIAVAGSVAINQITNQTIAEIENTTGYNLGSINIDAIESDRIWAGAGTVTFVTSIGSDAELEEGKLKTKIGLGLGFAQNLMSSTTHAIISNSNLIQSSGSLNINALQASRSFVLAAGTVFEAGKGVGISAYGMVALNQYTIADVQAVVSNSQITSTSAGSVSGMVIGSQLIPLMITAAGDLGLGISWKSGSGAEVAVGAGVAVTTVSINGNSIASVNHSNITLSQGNLTVSAYTGQLSNSTSLNNILANLNLPSGNFNLYSLSIAGGLSVSADPDGALAVGVNGVGAGIGSTIQIDTLADITANSNINLPGQNQSGGILQVKALENLNVYDNAGGASIDIAVSKNTAVGVAVGVGAGVHTGSGNVIASISGSNVSTAGDLIISANTTSSVKVIGFGVALDTAISDSGGEGISFSASSATATITSTQTISALIIGGNINSGRSLELSAVDNSILYAGLGSGSLSVAFGTEGGSSLAAGASVGLMNISHTITATIGSFNGAMLSSTNVVANGPISISAINNLSAMVQAIAVASSVGAGGEISIGLAGSGANATIATFNNITAGLYSGNNLSSKQTSGKQGVSIRASDNANLTTTVGTGAIDVAISEVPVGASIGVSLAQITNNDNVTAFVQGANITTQGSDVSVLASANNSHYSKSVATSVSISLGVAGAGGNSNIYDKTNISAIINTGSNIVTGNTSNFGNLTVLATTSEKVLAQIYGGSGGIGSLGVFLSDAERTGSTSANVATSGTLSVGSLTIAANANSTVTSEGMSITIGGLAGTGEVHKVNVNDLVSTNITGYSGTWHIRGNLSIGASGNGCSTAQTSGAGNSQTSISVSEYGAGYYNVTTNILPSVNVNVSDVNLAVSGSSQFVSIAFSNNRATARAGSGSLVGGDAATATTAMSPTVSMTTTNMVLQSGSTSFLAGSSLLYGTFADSLFATAAGGSAATANNSSTPDVSLNLGSGTSIMANGTVIISSFNNITGVGEGEATKDGGIMARVGSGGLVTGFGAVSSSCLTSDSNINMADGVSLLANNRGSILIGSAQNWNTNQLSNVNTGSAAGGTDIESLLASCLTNNIVLGKNVSLTSTGGSIGIGTSVNTMATSDCYSYTFGLVSASSSNAQNNQFATQNIFIGNNSLISAAGSISITPGVNSLGNVGTLIDNSSIITAHSSGLVNVPVTNASANSNSALSLVVNPGTLIVSDINVNLGPKPGINNALWYSFTNYNGSKGKTKSSTNGATQSSTATINGNVIAGNTHELNILIPEAGNLIIVNGQSYPLNNTSGNLNYITPTQGTHFLPFQLGNQTNYDTSLMLQGLDATSQAMLAGYISNTPVSAITLANLAATGGQVVINAGQLSGNGNISAFSPNISITNNSPAYLLLSGVGVPNLLNMGMVSLTGGASLPDTMTINQQSSMPSISIAQNYNGVVGTGTTSGPAIGIFSPVLNTGGSVGIYNAKGSFVQKSSITAASISIDTPSGAFIVNTPNSYFGSGGNIIDFWQSHYTNPNYVTPGAYANATAFTADQAATTAATILYLNQSGATNSIDFSNWLYNNQKIQISNFVNVNVTVNGSGEPTGVYPGKGQNWGTTEYGTGIIFFGSEIPYLWQTSPVNIISGQNYLSQSCQTGYLDTYENAQKYSIAASGSQFSGSLNVAQGTGPQYAANVGRGIYPVIPSYFPISQTENNPQNANLGSGLTAAQMSISALYIDINAPVNVGVLNNGFQANLSASLANYINSYIASNPSASCVPISSNYLGGNDSGLSAYYDVNANQIVLNPVVISAGAVSAVFTGNIISTTNAGKITVNSNGGFNLINNQSGYPLVIQGIGSPDQTVAGTVQFNDTVANLATAFVYKANNVVQKYQGLIGSNISQMQPVGNQSGASAAYNPKANMAFEWNQQSTISRNLSFSNTFSNDINNYNLYGPSIVDSWSWGGLQNGTAPSNYTSLNGSNPFTTSAGNLVTVPGLANQFSEVISAQITAIQSAKTYFINNAGFAWNFGPCSTWAWTYPTEIQFFIRNQLPACNPITIDFSGVSCGVMNINSGSDILIDGNIQFPGQVSIASGQNISQLAGALITAPQVCLTAGGSLGTSNNLLNLSLVSESPLNAQATNGIYIGSTGNIVTGTLAASCGPVVLQSGGGIQSGTSCTVSVAGTNISLLAVNGTIGTQAMPLIIQTHASVLATGSVTGGLLTASAPASIYLTQPNGDLRIASVSTSSPVGIVSITAQNGNITDAIITDVYDFNSGNLTVQQIGRVIQAIEFDNANAANNTVASYEGSVNQNYLQYWTMVANQTTIGNLTLNNSVYGLQFPLATVVQGGVNLTANGLIYYQQQANQYYYNMACQTANANSIQVGNYANLIFNNAVSVFQNNLAFGHAWSGLPQFQAYQSNYIFTASPSTVATLTYGAFDSTNSIAILSLDALSPKGQSVLGSSVTPVIQTSVLKLQASGSVGLSSSPVEIEMADIQSGNLTPYQKSLLAMATSAGELQYVGINANGQRIVFSNGSQPANVTISGVLVKIEKPLVVNLTNNGLAMVQAGTTAYLTESSGNLNLLQAISSGNMSIVSQGNISQALLQPSTTVPGWSLNSSGALGYNNGSLWQESGLILNGNIASGISAAGLRITSGGSIGSADNEINTNISGELNAYSKSHIFINSISGKNLLLGEVYADGQVSMTANSDVLESESILKGSIGGFGVNGNGWNLSSTGNGTATIKENILTLQQSQGVFSTSSAFYSTPLTVADSFITSFIYQSKTPGSIFYFLIQGTSVQGDTGNQPGGATVGLQINVPSASPQLQSIALMKDGVIQDLQPPGGINLASGDSIHVVLTYNAENNSVTVSLTDVNTQQVYSFTSPGINLLKVLGTPQGQLGFFSSANSQNCSQTVSGFSFSYGSPTIQGQSLALISSGQIGTANNPILTLLSGNISASAPDGVFILQTNGNMYVQSVTSASEVSLNAPVGSIVNSGSGPVQASGLIRSAAVSLPSGVTASHLQLESLYSIGAKNKPLAFQASGLAASAVIKDVCLVSTGSVVVDGGIMAGGLIDLIGDADISVTSSMKGAGPISIESLPNFYTGSRVIVEAGASIVSTGDIISILGGDGVSLMKDSMVASLGKKEKSQVLLASFASDLLLTEKFDVNVNGSMRSDKIRIDSQSANRNPFLNLSDIKGVSQNPVIDVLGGSGNNTLTIDDSAYTHGRRFVVDYSRIATPEHLVNYSLIDSVIMSLGSGDDIVDIGRKTGLTKIAINCGAGNDSIRTVISATEPLSQIIDGGAGFDQTLVDADSQPVWIQKDQVAALTGQVQFYNQDKIAVAGSSVTNALPIADRFVFEIVSDGRPLTNQKYVRMAYQQILNRNATSQELDMGTRQLDRHAITREQFARRLLNSSESLRLQINSWYVTYLNRQATSSELTRNLAALRRGNSSQVLVSQILAGQEFYNRTQQIVATGSSTDRFLTGIYRLVIAPTATPDAALMQFLRQTLQKQGRLGVANQVISSSPNENNQTQAIFIKVNQNLATGGISVGKIGPNGLTARLLSRK